MTDVPQRVVLVRHAEPVVAARGRVYGRLDVGLSPAGRAAAALLAARLAPYRPAICLSSPRARALETARVLDLDVVAVEALAEIDFGAFEGCSYDEVRERFPELYAVWMEAPTTITFPGGESYADVRRRALAALADARREHATATILVVSHGGVIRAMLADVLGVPDERIFRLGQDYCGVSVIDWFGDEPVVRLVNG